MHILLTRPLEDCKDLVIKFKSLGHKVSHLPVIKIQNIDYVEPNFNDFKGIIFTSANSVKNLNLLKTFTKETLEGENHLLIALQSRKNISKIALRQC